jgi:23S rRNA (uracil1939-C5)-methyltransferase
METITLDVTEMAHGGSAIGRAKRGRTVFVPLTIPGEKVRAQIVSEKNKYAQAELIQVLQPSPERVTAALPAFWRVRRLPLPAHVLRGAAGGEGKRGA